MTSTSNSDNVRLLRQRAVAALRSPENPESIAILEALTRVEPDHADHWFNLGYLQKLSGFYDLAADSYGRALSLGIAGPEDVYVNRAVIYYDHLHQPAAALRDLDAAMTARPGYPPALANLGLIAEEGGDRDLALAYYTQLATVDPGNATAQAKVALLGLAPTMAIDRLRALVDASAKQSPQRAELLFALASLLDRNQDYRAAFAAISEANAVRKALLPPQSRYRRDAIEDMVSRITSADVGRWPTANNDCRLVSICGMFRSGSTLIEHVLAAHSGVTALGEVDALPLAVARHLPEFPDGSVDAGQVAAMASDYLARLPAQRTGWSLDKRPDNILLTSAFLTAFPESKTIITKRQPLDNILSLYFLDFSDAVSYSFDLDDALHWYHQVERLRHRWRTLFPHRVYELSYDEFVQNPTRELAGVLDFIGLQDEDACHVAHSQSRIVRTPSAWQVRREPFTSSSGRWKNYEPFLYEQIARLP